MQAPTILEPVGMTVDECRTAVTGGLYRTEDGTNIVIDTTRSNRISYSYVSHGSLSYSRDNVFCNGDNSVVVNGKEHDGVVEMASVSIEFRRVTVQIPANGQPPVDTSDSTELPDGCNFSDHCANKEVLYILDREVGDGPGCPFHLVRAVEMKLERFQDQDDNTYDAYIDEKHAIFLPINEELPAPRSCAALFSQYTTTKFGTINVVRHSHISQTLGLSPLESRELDVGLEAVITSEFLFYRNAREEQKRFQLLGQNLCSFLRQGFGSYTRSPLMTQKSSIPKGTFYLK